MNATENAMTPSTDDLRISELKQLIAPAVLMGELPIGDAQAQVVADARRLCEAILSRTDDRLLVVIGPCSIHDPEAALEYAALLKKSAATHAKDLAIVMRVYFEKPRTTVGWKGLINDPGMDDTFDVNRGLRLARKLLLDLLELGVPAGTEFLDTIGPQFVADLISWGAIGARTTESQVHRELASGISAPMGFKNGTGGNIQIAIDAITAARRPHHFLSVTKSGDSAIVSTTGNEFCHVILRGSSKGPNYSASDIATVTEQLENANLPPYLMVDCSHGNSLKDYRKQPEVAQDLCNQIADGNRAIAAVMIESNLVEGNQPLSPGAELTYGQSITDACVSWDMTLTMLADLATAVRQRRSK